MDKEDNALHATRVSAVKGKHRPMDEYKKEIFGREREFSSSAVKPALKAQVVPSL